MSVRDSEIQGPAWDLSTEYASPDAPELQRDLDRATALMDEMEALAPALVDAGASSVAGASLAAGASSAAGSLSAAGAIPAAQGMRKLADEAEVLLRNVGVFANCLLSVDSCDEAAQVLNGRLQNYRQRYADLLQPLTQFCDLADEPTIDAYLGDPQVAPSAFLVRHARERRHELLSLPEEGLVNGLSQDGIQAWGNLYDQLSGTLSCKVLVDNEHREMGLAEASGLLQKPDDRLRRNAWQAINEAWEGHEETCAAAINAIAGWRLELCRKRSLRRPVHFLDAPVHMNRIHRDTLEALLQVSAEHREMAQRAARLQAAAYGKTAIGPWDSRAPAPVISEDQGPGIAFADAIRLIADAYAGVHPEMGDFVHMMVRNRWIEGSRGNSKRPGAYCTGFAKSRTPRVYTTFTGGASDVMTLAHELGHAYHSWVMRDLPESQRSYGMSLAETASTFGETLVRDAMLQQAGAPQARLEVAWEDMSALVTFVLNIPTRFEFEKGFYERRQERPLRPAELKSLMSEAWNTWYGDAVSEPDPMFWASKLHFYISGLSFYNFPYLFGYLFSLGLYARRQAEDTDFYPRYVALLRDTGRMTAEDLAERHLDTDIRQPEFWRDALGALAPRVNAFEELLQQAGRAPAA